MTIMIKDVASIEATEAIKPEAIASVKKKNNNNG
jgi:hypothetical protein